MLEFTTLSSKVIFLVVTLTVGIIAIILVAVGSSGTFTNSFSVEALNDPSLFPNGTYSAHVSSFSQASSSLSLTKLDRTTLSQIGVSDRSSLTFEAGRLQYMYFRVPASSSGNVVSHVALHFGSAGSNDGLVVIPIPSSSGSSQQTSGVVLLQTMSDGSVIVRIQMTVAASLCTSSSNNIRDGCFSAKYQARVIVNQNQITSSISMNFYVGCGNLCSFASSVCGGSCTTCDGQQVAGADTPVSRRYDMGSTSATFTFDYDTYTIKDRITVWNGATRVFDTGCVGASGSVSISYSSSSSSIRVDVEPNCDCTSSSGCSGTAWNFKVHCLTEKSG